MSDRCKQCPNSRGLGPHTEEICDAVRASRTVDEIVEGPRCGVDILGARVVAGVLDHLRQLQQDPSPDDILPINPDQT